jgi:outer membrane biosynthesis protein TonB
VLLHGGIALLLVLRVVQHHESEPGRITIINAELLIDGMRSDASGPATASNDAPTEPQRGGESAAAATESAELTANVSEPQPPLVEPAEKPPAPTPPPRAAPRRAEERPAPAAQEQPPVAAADDVTPKSLPHEAAAVESQVAEAQAAPHAAEAPPAAVAASKVEPSRPGKPIEGKQRAKLERRFASWTGSLDDLERTVTWKDAGQQYSAVLRRQPADGAMGMEHLVVEISTEQNGRKMSTEMRMARLSFSSFAQFVDRWNPDVAIHDDQIDGRFHSNSEIKVMAGGGGSPRFNGKVTLAAHTFESDGFMSRARLFPQGVDLNVRRIALPSRLVPLSGADADEAQVLRFERGARITFYADATFGWQYLDSSDPELRVAVDPRAQYLIGAEDAELHIRGTVDGRVLVYTPDDIVIEDDLVYARDPRVDADADDYVGLVAEGNVVIAPPSITGSGDLTVQASIYAHRQFAVRTIYSRRAGTLNIYGSVAAGTLSATEPRYATRIEFDERLASARPPSFPLSDRYELEGWSGEWQLDPNDARFDTDEFLKADEGAELIEPDAAGDPDADEAEAVATDAAVRDR